MTDHPIIGRWYRCDCAACGGTQPAFLLTRIHEGDAWGTRLDHPYERPRGSAACLAPAFETHPPKGE